MDPKREGGGDEEYHGGDGRRSNERGRGDQREEYSWRAQSSGSSGGQFGGDGSRDSSGRGWDRKGCSSRERSSGVSFKVETGSVDVKEIDPKKERSGDEGYGGDDRRSNERGRGDLREYSWRAQSSGSGGGVQRHFERGESWDSRGGEWEKKMVSDSRSSSGVSSKAETGSGGGGVGVDVDVKKEVWEAPMPGEWRQTVGSGVPSWDRTLLKEEENPPDWVEPPQPKDFSKAVGSICGYEDEFFFKRAFTAEVHQPPVTDVEDKMQLLTLEDIPDHAPVVVVFARGYVRTTRKGLMESKRLREKEEKEIELMLTERGFFRGRGRGGGRGGHRGRGGGRGARGRDGRGVFNPNMEPVAGNRGFGGSREREGSSRGGGEGERYFESSSRRDGGGHREHSRDERSSRERGSDLRRDPGDGKSGEGHRDSRSENRAGGGDRDDWRRYDSTRGSRSENREAGEGRDKRYIDRPREDERRFSRSGDGSKDARQGQDGAQGGREHQARPTQGGNTGTSLGGGGGQGGGAGGSGSRPAQGQSYKEWKEANKRKSGN